MTIIDFFSYILIACKQIMQQISINFCFHEPYEDVLVDLHNFVSLNRKQTFAICLSLIPIQVRVPYWFFTSCKINEIVKNFTLYSECCVIHVRIQINEIYFVIIRMYGRHTVPFPDSSESGPETFSKVSDPERLPSPTTGLMS